MTNRLYGDELQKWCENYIRPVRDDGQKLKCKDYTKEQLSEFRRWTNYRYRLQPEKQVIANEAARLRHHTRKKEDESYQRNAYLNRIGGTYKRKHMTKDFLELQVLD